MESLIEEKEYGALLLKVMRSLVDLTAVTRPGSPKSTGRP